MRLTINGVDINVPDDMSVTVAGGSVSIGAVVPAVPRITHDPQVARQKLEPVPPAAWGKARVNETRQQTAKSGRPRKVHETTEQVRESILRLLRKANRPCGTRMFSMNIKLTQPLSPSRKNAYIMTVLHEMVAEGLIQHRLENGKNHWWCLPDVPFEVKRYPSGNINRGWRASVAVPDDVVDDTEAA